ncbi:hypothetical protein N7528_006497 [Penicillium herquei]|nr:hypothetical protein N7528_006497 [Penicillium herquei]
MLYLPFHHPPNQRHKDQNTRRGPNHGIGIHLDSGGRLLDRVGDIVAALRIAVHDSLFELGGGAAIVSRAEGIWAARGSTIILRRIVKKLLQQARSRINSKLDL